MEITFKELWRVTGIKRWHMVETIRNQTVAEHSFNVAMLTVELLKGIDSAPVHAIMVHALTHNFDEAITGDIAPQTKARLGVKSPDITVQGWGTFNKSIYSDTMPELSYRIVKLADSMEALMFIRQFGVGGWPRS